MNRKEGIDYFPVKCAADKNIELVTAECQKKRFAMSRKKSAVYMIVVLIV